MAGEGISIHLYFSKYVCFYKVLGLARPQTVAELSYTGPTDIIYIYLGHSAHSTN